MSDQNKLSRRDFIKEAAVVAGASAAALAGAGELVNPAQAQTQSPPGPAALPAKWDKEADVVVVGAGGAGMCAAIEARDAGAQVLVLEKANVARGCTGICGGAFAGAVTEIQQSLGIKDDPEVFTWNWMRAGADIADPDVIRAVTYLSGDTVNWYEKLGGKLRDTVRFALARSITLWDGTVTTARIYESEEEWRFMSTLVPVAQKKGAEILLETPATKLYRDSNGRVVGVEAKTKDGKTLAVKARRGVILATGGIGGSVEMTAKYIPILRDVIKNAKKFLSVSWPYDTGDGLEMARAIGADWATFAPYYSAPSYVEVTPGRGDYKNVPAITASSFAAEGAITVNTSGKRFNDETVSSTAWRSQTGRLFYIVLDSNIKKQPLTKPSGDIMDAQIKAGNPNVAQADTIEQLATKLGLPAQSLKSTVDTWNGYVKAGKDPEFGRTKMGAGIQVPPFFGVEVCPAVIFSKGGLKITPKGEVVDYRSQVIPGLYAAGDVASGLIQGAALTHVVGGGIAIAFNFGRITGKNAAAQKAWDAV